MFLMSGLIRWRAAALALLPTLALAQSAPEDEALVITASRTEQRLRDAIPHTTVLTQKEIRDSQAVDLPALLRSEAGIEVTQNGGIGGNSSLFMRGGRSAQALILVDGVRMEDVSFGTTALQHLMLDEVERVEIVRGNVSSLYGSGAIGGVVQVFTKRGRSAPAPYGELMLGSRNTSKLSAGYGGRAGDTSFNVTASRFDTRGFSAMDPALASLANPDPDGYRNESFTGSISHRLSRRHEFGASFLQTHGRADLDGNTAFLGDTPTTQHQISQDLGMLQAYWEARFVEAWKSRVTAAEGTDYRTENRDGAFDNRSNTRNRQLIWDNDLQLAPQHRVSIGVEQLRQALDNQGVFAIGERTREVDIARLGYLGRIGRHSLQANVRSDEYSDFGSADTWFLGYGLDLTDAWRLTASASTAFRAPTFQDLFGFGGNPQLKPERARTRELGAQWARDAQRLRVVAFDTEYEDAISFDLLTFTAANVRKARVSGIETSYTGRFAGFELRASMTFQDPIEQEPGGEEEQAIRRAKRFGSLAVYRTLRDWRLGAELRASASRPDADIETFAPVREAGYTVMHLTARYQVAKALFVAARVENALDEEYRLVHGFNTPPRGLFVTAGLQL
jgi:vitamin B12 transporter